VLGAMLKEIGLLICNNPGNLNCRLLNVFKRQDAPPELPKLYLTSSALSQCFNRFGCHCPRARLAGSGIGMNC
jgi:hypothetical protein